MTFAASIANPPVRAHARSAGLRWAGRVFWFTMLAGHMPGWLAAGAAWLAQPDSGHFLRLAAMTASQVFFALRLLDAPWLRMPRATRAWLATTIVFALLHAGVAHELWAGDYVQDIATPAILSAGSAAVLLAGRHAGQQLGRACRGSLSPGRCQQRMHLLERAEAAALLPPRVPLIALCRLNRAPPR